MWKSGWMLTPLAAVAVLILTGCRNSACEDLAEVYADVARKSEPCMESAPLPPVDALRCEQNLQACGDQDLVQLEAQIKCYRSLGTCQPEQKASFLQGITRCDRHALSNSCEAAIF
jgi:Tfp pilus assembly protein PilP